MERSYFIKNRVWAMTLALFFLLVGCCRMIPESQNAPYRVVTQIHILYQNGRLEAERSISKPDKLQSILDYLRQIDPYGTPFENPEEVSGSNFHITVLYSDGTSRLYRQRADRYMCIDDGPWKRIDPQKALELSRLMGAMASDPPPVDSSPAMPPHHPQI